MGGGKHTQIAKNVLKKRTQMYKNSAQNRKNRAAGKKNAQTVCVASVYFCISGPFKSKDPLKLLFVF